MTFSSPVILEFSKFAGMSRRLLRKRWGGAGQIRGKAEDRANALTEEVKRN